MIIEVLKKPCQGRLCPVFVESFQESFLIRVTFGKLTWGTVTVPAGHRYDGRWGWWWKKSRLESSEVCSTDFSVVVGRVARMSRFSLYFNEIFLIIVWGTKSILLFREARKAKESPVVLTKAASPAPSVFADLQGNGPQRSASDRLTELAASTDCGPLLRAPGMAGLPCVPS